MAVYTFKKAVTFEGKTYDKIEYDFDSLTGGELMALKNEYQKLNAKDLSNKSVLTLTLDSDFVTFALAKQTKLPIEFFLALSAKEFIALQSEVISFFYS